MPPVTITLYEHQSISYDSAGLFPQQPSARERLLDAIERLNAASGLEILHLGRKSLRANSLVGVLRIGDITFEILPKIDGQPPVGSGETHPPLDRSTARNLLAMLSHAGNLRIYPQEIAGLDSAESSWFELLTRLFAADLYLQVQAGLPQAYITREERLPVLRGRWDIQRQLARHPDDPQHFSVIYDELTADTPLAQVFRFTVERLLPLSSDPENRRLLGTLREWLSSTSLLTEIPESLLNKITFNRLNERCRPAFHLARLFLSASAPRLTAGGVPAYAFVFDMNALFERFIAAFIERHRSGLLPPEWQPAKILIQSERMPVYLANAGEKKAFRLRPDLLLVQGTGAPLLVADTKYKQIRLSRGQPDIPQEDIYQMVAYGVRLRTQRLLLLYPQSAGEDPIRSTFDIESTTTRLFVATVNLHSPLADPAPLIDELRAIFAAVAA